MGSTLSQLPQIRSLHRYQLYSELRGTFVELQTSLQITVVGGQPNPQTWNSLQQRLSQQLKVLELPSELVPTVDRNRSTVESELAIIDQLLADWRQRRGLGSEGSEAGGLGSEGQRS